MPALWPVFEGQLNNWFNNFAEGGDQTSTGADTAAQIASAYDKALKTATIVGKGNLLTGGTVIIPTVEIPVASKCNVFNCIVGLLLKELVMESTLEFYIPYLFVIGLWHSMLRLVDFEHC